MLSNMVMLEGRLTRDPEIRTTPNGNKVATFTVAVNGRKTKDGQEESSFIECSAWMGSADFLEKYFRKGSPISLTGRLQQRRWKDKDGNNRNTLGVVAEEIGFPIGSGRSPDTQQNRNGTYHKRERQQESSNESLPW